MQYNPWMLRSILYYLFFSVVASIFSILVLLVIPFSRQMAHDTVRSGARIVIRGLKWFCKLDFQIEGLAHFQPGKTYVVVANHQSAWETVALLAYLPRATFVLKRELLWIPILGIVIWGISPVSISRSDGAASLKKISSQGRRVIQKQINLVLFPEGTRMEGGTLGKFKKGAARIAIESGCSVIPVVHNAGVFWPKSTIVKKPGVIRVKIGEAIAVEGLSFDELNDRLLDWMHPALATLPKH